MIRHHDRGAITGESRTGRLISLAVSKNAIGRGRQGGAWAGGTLDGRVVRAAAAVGWRSGIDEDRDNRGSGQRWRRCERRFPALADTRGCEAEKLRSRGRAGRSLFTGAARHRVRPQGVHHQEVEQLDEWPDKRFTEMLEARPGVLLKAEGGSPTWTRRSRRTPRWTRRGTVRGWRSTVGTSSEGTRRLATVFDSDQ